MIKENIFKQNIKRSLLLIVLVLTIFQNIFSEQLYNWLHKKGKSQPTSKQMQLCMFSLLNYRKLNNSNIMDECLPSECF